jgi:hypothetical protein
MGSVFFPSNINFYLVLFLKTNRVTLLETQGWSRRNKSLITDCIYWDIKLAVSVFLLWRPYSAQVTAWLFLFVCCCCFCWLTCSCVFTWLTAMMWGLLSQHKHKGIHYWNLFLKRMKGMFLWDTLYDKLQYLFSANYTFFGLLFMTVWIIACGSESYWKPRICKFQYLLLLFPFFLVHLNIQTFVKSRALSVLFTSLSLIQE